MATIRSYIFIDQLQPKTMCYLGTFVRGFLPRTNMAALVVEVAPGLEIEAITDIAVKNVDVKPGLLVVERQYGYLELHSHSTSSVKAAGQAVLDHLGASEADAMRPEILASRIVKRVDSLNLPSYSGFVMPKLTAVNGADGAITDVEISYPMDLTKQMLEFAVSSR